MKIPALKEIPASEINYGQRLYGWFDVADKEWHVIAEGVRIVDRAWVGLTLELNDAYFFGAESRLLVEDK